MAWVWGWTGKVGCLAEWLGVSSFDIAFLSAAVTSSAGAVMNASTELITAEPCRFIMASQFAQASTSAMMAARAPPGVAGGVRGVIAGRGGGVCRYAGLLGSGLSHEGRLLSPEPMVW